MVLWTLAVGFVLILWILKLNKDYFVLALFAKRVKTADGAPLEQIVSLPKGRTIFGSTFDNFGLDSAGLFQFNRKRAADYKRSYIEYGMGAVFYNIIAAEDAELVLNDSNLITKGIVYNFLQPFLRTGLLTSTDKKWHSRRKMLTPAFHFNILEQFEDIFKEESHKFVKNLQTLDNKIVSLSELIPIFTLNSVCETALGIQLDERLDGSQYRESFKMIEECFVKRLSNPLYFFEGIFNMMLAKNYEQDLKNVHEFSSDIIEKRRKLFAEEMLRQSSEKVENIDPDDVDFIFKKKRYAMLDTLLRAEKDGLIDHLGICEEVDTFMFEGFDTTSMGLIFGLMNLSLYPELQQRCYEEIIENIDDDLSKLDITQLNKLQYLEYFIKETLRLYPSVPVIMRTAKRETKLANNLILPAGTHITLHIFDIQRNPKHFQNPNTFDPDRFLPENAKGRHPFAYIPFSAGQRNCIGQKFALLEMKTLIVYVLKHFKILPLVDPNEFAFESGIIIRSKTNVKVKLVKRT